jgi:hypothetical protein
MLYAKYMHRWDKSSGEFINTITKTPKLASLVKAFKEVGPCRTGWTPFPREVINSCDPRGLQRCVYRSGIRNMNIRYHRSPELMETITQPYGI